MIKHISENEFEVEVLKEEGLVIVDFFATWCGPCKMLAPILDGIHEEMKNIKIVKIDVDENPEVARKYEVQNLPTIKLFKKGEEVDTKVGFLPKGILIETIEKFI